MQSGGVQVRLRRASLAWRKDAALVQPRIGTHVNIRKFRVKLLRVVFLLFFVPAALLLGRRPYGQSVADFAVLSAGSLLVLLGVTMRTWAVLYLGCREAKGLVTLGPYSLCRNPLYLGTFLILVGSALCFRNVVMAAFAFVAVLPIHVAAILSEERRLTKLYGAAYEAYRRATPRFLPNPWRYRSSSEVVLPTRAIRRAAVDGVGFLLIPAFARLVELLQQAGVLPVIWHLP